MHTVRGKVVSLEKCVDYCDYAADFMFRSHRIEFKARSTLLKSGASVRKNL